VCPARCRWQTCQRITTQKGRYDPAPPIINFPCTQKPNDIPRTGIINQGTNNRWKIIFEHDVIFEDNGVRHSFINHLFKSFSVCKKAAQFTRSHIAAITAPPMGTVIKRGLLKIKGRPVHTFDEFRNDPNRSQPGDHGSLAINITGHIYDKDAWEAHSFKSDQTMGLLL
jgi:hypothetical protein